MDMPDAPNVRHRFVNANGTRFHVAEAGDANAPTVLLLHGFPQHWYMWRDVIAPLAATSHVLAIDLRGFGWSDAPAAEYSTRERVRDVLALLDELGIERADIVGHDWGAWLAFRLALDHPDRIDRVVAVSMMHPWPMQRHLMPTVWRWWVTALFEVPVVGEWMLRSRPRVTRWLLARDSAAPTVWTDELLDSYASIAAQPPRAAAGRRLHTQLVLRDIQRLLLARDRHRVLTSPVLIVVGDRDALLPAAAVTVPASRRGSLTVRVIEGGHFLVDTNPLGVLGAITDHLTRAHHAPYSGTTTP